MGLHGGHPHSSHSNWRTRLASYWRKWRVSLSSVGYDTVNGWDYMEGILTAESLKLENQARFILEKVEGVIVIGRL